MPSRTNYFSMQLSKLLAALGKSQKELAAQTNISESKLSKLQSGKLEPKHKDIQKIAEALKICIELINAGSSVSFPQSSVSALTVNRICNLFFSESPKDSSSS